MYEKLIKQCRDCLDSLCGECKYKHLQKDSNYVPCMNALLGEAADAIEVLLSEIEKYRHAAFVIGETCVDESKRHISADDAIQKIRKHIYYCSQMRTIESPKEEK